MWILVLVVLIGLGYSIWQGLVIYQDGWNDDMLIPVIVYPGFVIPLFLLLSWVFRGYFVRVDEGGIDFGYSLWNVHLDNSQIIYAKKVEIRWLEWGGMGVRMKGFKHIGYILNSGPGIEISSSVKNKKYTFSCEDTDTIIFYLKNNGVKIKNEYN